MTYEVLSTAALGVLEKSPRPLTIPEICASDFALTYETNQKVAKVLNGLVEDGLVKKTKSRAKGRMIYTTVSNLVKQGYDMNTLVC